MSVDPLAAWLMARVEIVARAEGPPIDGVALGDSTFWRVADQDTRRDPLGAMLCDALPGRCAWVAANALAADHYACVLELLLRRGVVPKNVVAVANLRSFSPTWHARPRYRLRATLDALSDAVAHGWRGALPGDADAPPPEVEVAEPEGALRAYDAIPHPTPAEGLRTLGEVRRFLERTRGSTEAQRLRVVFGLYHGVAISDEHPVWGGWRRLAALCADHGCRLWPYVAPINVECADRCAGSGVRAAAGENARRFASEAAGWAGVAGVLDLHDAYPPARFVRPTHPTEHLDAAGRLDLARRVGAWVGGAAAGRGGGG
ncbi:MAG: hypothetical protein AAGA57_03400 [Planctomycetota bacterium]